MFKIGVVEFDYGHDSGGATYGTQTVYRVEIDPGSLAEANAMRYQLLGQKDKIVAVVWDDDPMVDGLYIQRDCSVSPIANYLATGRMSANVVLERAPNVIEASYTLTDRTGGFTPTSMTAFGVHGYGVNSVGGLTDISGLDFTMSSTRKIAGEDDSVARVVSGSSSFVDGTSTVVRQGCDPKEYNVGRCRIEVNGGDEAGWWTLTGTTVPEGHDVRVSNGVIRIQVVYGKRYVLSEQWDIVDGGWVPCARYLFEFGGNTTGEFNRRFEVRRNDHASVEISCAMPYSVKLPFFVDLKLVRGVAAGWATSSLGRFGAAATSKVTMQEYDGSNMATSLAALNGGLKRSAAIGNETPHLHAENTGVTLSTTTDDSSKTSSSFHLVGIGQDVDSYKAEVQVSDRLVY